METVGKAKRVRIYVSEDDRWGRRPLHLAIIELLRRENAQGATVRGHKVVAVTDADGLLAGIVDRADLLHGLIPHG